MKVIEQTVFSPVTFNSSCCNLHKHSSGQRSQVIAFVHGLGGSGYGTWEDFPRFLFDGDNFDVATFNFQGLFRGQGESTMVHEIVSSLWELDERYESIYLIGHSHGGLLVEAAAADYLTTYLARGNQVTPLAAMVLLAVPRAGTGWVPKWLPLPPGKLRMLKRDDAIQERLDEFISSSVQSETTADVPAGRVLCPIYVCAAGRDRWVSQFSSTFGISGRQRIHLALSHRELAKPSIEEREVVDWLVKLARDVNETRQQWHREEKGRGEILASLPPEASPTVVTEFWGHSDCAEWEAAYNQARNEVSTPELVALDRRDMKQGTPVDLLITVSKAVEIIGSPAQARSAVNSAHNKRMENEKLTVGLSSVGCEFEEAARNIRQWLGQLQDTTSVYVQGVADTSALYIVMLQWLQLVIERDPRRVVRLSPERLLEMERPEVRVSESLQ